MVNVYLSGTVANEDGNTSGSVGPVTSEAVAQNHNRMCLTLVNDGPSTVYLGIGARAEINKGVRLNANGGSYEINSLNLSTGTVNAITSSGTSSLCVMEMGTQ